MSHKTACGWSQVRIDSGPVRPCGPVPFAVTRFRQRKILGSLVLTQLPACDGQTDTLHVSKKNYKFTSLSEILS